MTVGSGIFVGVSVAVSDGLIVWVAVCDGAEGRKGGNVEHETKDIAQIRKHVFFSIFP